MIITKGYVLADMPRLYEINVACYSGIQRPSPAEFADMMAGGVFLAKNESLHIIGFALVRRRDTYLWSLAVDPSYQGRGVGGNLLREVIKFYTLAKETEISLHVHPDNPAMKLYFDYGFRVKAVAKNWYMAE